MRVVILVDVSDILSLFLLGGGEGKVRGARRGGVVLGGGWEFLQDEVGGGPGGCLRGMGGG